MKVKVKATGTVINVYKHANRATYVDAVNCTDEYKVIDKSKPNEVEKV
jgi:hypothetical protein